MRPCSRVAPNRGPFGGVVRLWPVLINECPADLDGDGLVNAADLVSFLGAWDTPDGDGGTDSASLLAQLAARGVPLAEGAEARRFRASRLRILAGRRPASGYTGGKDL